MRSLASFFVLLCVTTGVAQAQDPPTIIFAGATLIDGTGAVPVADAIVVVRDGRIVCAGTRVMCAVQSGARTIDVTGKWLTPGLVDAHVHYSQTGWADGRPDSYDARERFPYDSTIAWLREPARFYRSWLCSGVTATFDVGGYPWTWGLRRAAETAGDAPHVAAAGPLLSTRDHWLNLPAERQFLHIATDSAVEAGAHYLAVNRTDAFKVWFLVGAGAQDTAVWARRIRMAGNAARDASIPLIVHATNLWGATRALDAGATLLVHGVADQPVDQTFLDLAKRNGTVYTPTLVVNDGYRQLRARSFEAANYELSCVDPDTRAKAFLTDSLPDRPDSPALDRARQNAARQFALDADNVRRVHQAGIPVAVGTDAGNPLTLHGPSIYLEMEALQRAGLSPTEVIVAATRIGAVAKNRLADFGTVEAGKIADLLILDADPTADIRNMRRPSLIVRGGTVHRRTDLEYR
jgi:imidazolonepropionase-like amidohydrolase